MKKIIYQIALCFSILLLALTILPTQAVLAEEDKHKPITQELIDLVDKNPEIKSMLEASIAEAKKINPDLTTNSRGVHGCNVAFTSIF
jgi:hypothetical protein